MKGSKCVEKDSCTRTLSEGALTLLARALAVRLSGADTGDLSGCRAAVRHCQVPLSDQLSGAVSAVGCCRVRV